MRLKYKTLVNCPFGRAVNLLFCLLILVIVTGCSDKKTTEQTDRNGIENKDFKFDLVIGELNQSMDYQLGDPLGVRTDSEGNIYIADRSALQIKVFDSDGSFIKEIGRRGRGPAEFNDIFTFDITPEGNFVVVDKGNFRFTSITPNGEEIFTTPIEINEAFQYFPNDVAYSDTSVIGLHIFSGATALAGNVFERPLFHVTDQNFQEIEYSFLPFNSLEGLKDDKFAFISFISRAGSFVINNDRDQIFYSPFIYTGIIYNFHLINGQWVLNSKLSGVEPFSSPYDIFDEAEFEKHQMNNIPGIKRIYYDRQEPYMGRVNSADAGIYYLSDGRLIQFRSEWRDNYEPSSENERSLDISVQIFDSNYTIQEDKYLFSINATSRPWRPTVNWIDEENNFYVIDNSIDVPRIKRFSLEQILGNETQ